MEQSTVVDQCPGLGDYISEHNEPRDTIKDAEAGIPNLSPQKQKATNQNVPELKDSDKGSKVWHYFTKIEGSDPVKATCHHCKKATSAKSQSGTSAMWNHLGRCPANSFKKKEKNQRSIDDFASKFERKTGEEKESCKLGPLNVEEIRKALATMIIVDELSFRIVEGEGFKGHSKALEPRFIVPSRNTVASDCLKIFAKEKVKLKKMIKNHQLCLTTDSWTSIQNFNYMCLTAHWIDENWLYQKRILNFQLIESHAGRVVGRSIEECLLEWGVENVFTVTVDNASSNDTCLGYLTSCVKWKDPILYSKYMHVRYAAHILNLIVKEGFAEQDNAIVRIRNAIRYVRCSPSKYSLFKKCVEKEKIACKRIVSLDVNTRWSSTYQMLEDVEKFEKAFLRMEGEDPSYKKYFTGGYGGEGKVVNELTKKRVNKKKGDKKIIGPPKHEDFEVARCFARFLKLFYSVTLKFSGSLYTTSNTFFRELVAIHSAIKALSLHDDVDLKSMAFKMMEKFDKYWSFNSKTNHLLFVAIVLDPCFKLDYVGFCFGEMYGHDSTSTKSRIASVAESLDELYNEYKRLHSNDKDKNESPNSSESSHGMDIDECDKSFDFLDLQFAKRMQSIKKTESASEISR